MNIPYVKVDNPTCGSCLRIAGSGILAHNTMFALEPGRTWLVRYAGIRVTDSSDPELDAIDRGVAFYDAAKNQLMAPDNEETLASIAPTIATGRWISQATISYGGGANIIAPPGAHYFRPFVRTYGNTPVTDVEVIEAEDISDIFAFGGGGDGESVPSVTSYTLLDTVDGIVTGPWVTVAGGHYQGEAVGSFSGGSSTVTWEQLLSDNTTIVSLGTRTSPGVTTAFDVSEGAQVRARTSGGGTITDVSAFLRLAGVGAGSGLPLGGTTGQIIIKQSATDGDAAWSNIYPNALTPAQAEAAYVNLTGDTMTGALKVITPVAPEDAAPKSYVDTKAPFASPVFTGTPTAPTAGAGTATTQLATTGFVTSAVANLPAPASTLRSFGAVGDGTTNDRTAILAAFASGDRLTGENLTYAVSGNLNLVSGLYLEDTGIKQLDPAGSRRTFNASTVNNITMRRVKLDRSGDGTDPAAGNSDAAGFYIITCNDVVLEDVEITGNATGGNMQFFFCNRVKIIRPHIHDIHWFRATDPGGEVMGGIGIIGCTDVVIDQPDIHELTGSIAGGPFVVRGASDGITIGQSRNVSVFGGTIKRTGDGSDVTGSGVNYNIWFYGTYYEECGIGQKFIQEWQQCGSVGCRAYRCELYGACYNGANGVAHSIGGADMRVTAFQAVDTGYGGYQESQGQNVVGIAVNVGDGGPKTQKNVVLTDCIAVDNQTTPTMMYGFRNEGNTAAVVTLVNPYVRGAKVADYLGFNAGEGWNLWPTGPAANDAHLVANGFGQAPTWDLNLHSKRLFSTARGTLTLVNGHNVDLAAPINSLLNTSGPTAAFSIGGIVPTQTDGQHLWIVHLSNFELTIVNQDPLSGVGNKILTQTGANATLTGPCALHLVYDGTYSSWFIVSMNEVPMSVNLTGIPTAPTAAAGTSTNQIATTAFVQESGSGSTQFASRAELQAQNFAGDVPDFVTVMTSDGRGQQFQHVADYPVAVIERLANPSFETSDVWGLTVGICSLSAGACSWSGTGNGNATQLGVKPTVPGATYEIRTVVSSYTKGTLTPQLLSPGTLNAPSITAAGTFTSRVTTPTDPVNGAMGTLRLAGVGSFQGTVIDVSLKRVMNYACVVSADGLIWAPAGDINVLAYGVVADGVADDTVALKDAISIAYNMNRKALLPPASMRVTDTICDFQASGLVQIEGDPGRTILINEKTSAGGLFLIYGRFDGWNVNNVYLTAPALQGTRTLTLNDTSTLTVGQDIQVKDFSQPIEYYDKIYTDDLTRICALNGEVNRVRSIDSPTQITLGSQLEFDFTANTVLAGTVSTTSGVNVVTGVGTSFDTTLVPHQYISIAGVGSGSPLKVRKVVSATVLWVDIAATAISNTVSGAAITKLGTVVQRWTDRTEVQISGIRAIGNPTITVPNTNLVYDFRGIRRGVFTDLSFVATGCSEFSLWRCLRANITNYYSEDAARVGLDSYCIKLLNGCRSVQIINGYAMRPRHFITTTNDEVELEVSYILLSNCHVDQPMVGAYDQHPGGRNWLFSNCSCQGADFDGSAAVGFEVRGHDITLVNCQASGLKYGLLCAFGYNINANTFLANGCDFSCFVTQAYHVDIKDLVSRNALTNDVSINSHYWASGLLPLPDIRIQGRGFGNPSGDSVTATQWGTDWVVNFRNLDATAKYATIIPASYWAGNNFRELNVKEFGATGDGVTDDAPAIKRAMLQGMALKETVIIPKGRYYLGSPVTDATPQSHVKVRGDGEDTVLFTAIQNNGIFLNLGTLTLGSTLSAPATMGDRTLTVLTTTGYVVDQDVEIRDESQRVIDWDDGVSSMTNKGEMNRVRTIVDSTHLLLWSRLEDNYNVGTKVNRLGTNSTDWDIRDLAFEHTPGTAIDAAQRGFAISRMRRVYMDNLVFRGFDSACIRTAFVIDSVFTNIRGEGLNSSDPAFNMNPYLILAAEGTYSMICERLYLRQGRHCFTTGSDTVYIEPAHITVSDSAAYECMLAGFDTHPGARRITFDNCDVWGSDIVPTTTTEGDGYQMRGRQGVLRNCRASAVRHGAQVSFCEDNVIQNCDFANCDKGLHIVNSPKTVVKDVMVRNAKVNAVWVEHQNAPVIRDIRLSDIMVYGNTSGPCIDFGGYWHDSYVVENIYAPDAITKFSSDMPWGHYYKEQVDTVKYETMPRRTVSTATQTASPSGVLYMVGLWMDKGERITELGAVFGAATIGQTNLWYALYDRNRVKIGVTSDALTTVPVAGAHTKLSLATPYTTAYRGLYYVGIVQVAGTTGGMRGYTISGNLSGRTPILCGDSTASLTTPATAPTTAAVITAGSVLVWATAG